MTAIGHHKEPPPLAELRRRAGSHYYRLIEGVLHNALHARNCLLCCLSAEDEEWGSAGVVPHAKRYRMLMRYAKELASQAFEEGTEDAALSAFMTALAIEINEPIILPWEQGR